MNKEITNFINELELMATLDKDFLDNLFGLENYSVTNEEPENNQITIKYKFNTIHNSLINRLMFCRENNIFKKLTIVTSNNTFHFIINY